MTSTSKIVQNEDISIMESNSYKRKVRCMDLYENGMSTREISKELEVSQRTIQRYISEFIINDKKYPTPKVMKVEPGCFPPQFSYPKDPFYKFIIDVLSKPPYAYGYIKAEWDYSIFSHLMGSYGRKNNKTYLYEAYYTIMKNFITEKKIYSSINNDSGNNESVWELQINSRSIEYFRNNKRYKAKYYIFTAYCLSKESKWVVMSSDGFDESLIVFNKLIKMIKKIDKASNGNKKIVISTKSNKLIRELVIANKNKIYKKGVILLSDKIELQDDLRKKKEKNSRDILQEIN